MIFRPYYYYDTGCAAYVFGCGSMGNTKKLKHPHAAFVNLVRRFPILGISL